MAESGSLFLRRLRGFGVAERGLVRFKDLGMIQDVPASGTVIVRGKQPALTAQDAAVVDATYGSEEQGVIANNRTRIAEIETALQNVGIQL